MSGKALIVITGKLAVDPEMRFLPDGTAVTNFMIYTGNGADSKDTLWKVAAWRKSAEWCAENLAKDSVVMVHGSLNVQKDTGEPRLWDSRDGAKHTELSINAERVDPIDNFGKGKSAQSTSKPSPKVDFDEEDEIPF